MALLVMKEKAQTPRVYVCEIELQSQSFPERVINPALRWQYKEAERNYRL